MIIPNQKQIYALFDKYNLPSTKRIHVEKVTRLAKFLAKKIKSRHPKVKINISLLVAAGLLHDIDKNVKKKPGERHPAAAVGILKQHKFDQVAEIVAKHSLHCILEEKTRPKTWEEKLIYLADKMVKYELIGVDHRFALWRKDWKEEGLPQAAYDELEKTYPQVKALEKEIFSAAGITWPDVQRKLAVHEIG